MKEQRESMRTGKKILIALIAVFLLLTAAAYFTGLWYFSGHFLPGSMVNGFNCSYMTADEAQELLSRKVAAYAIAVRTRNNGQEGLSAEQAGIVYEPDGSVAEMIRGQDRFVWFLAFGQKRSYQTRVAAACDEAKLQQALQELDCMQLQNVIMPSNAFIRDNGESFEIVPEVEGNYLDSEKVLETVSRAMLVGEPSVDLEEEGCYKAPEIRQDDEELIRGCRQMNELTDIIVTYDFADRTERVDRSVIKDWLVKGADGNYTLDRRKVLAYVNELGYKYDTFGCTRTFRTYDEREITVTGGDYGWVIDKEAETDELISVIRSGVTQVREPVYLYEGWSRDTNDIGYTYVEIDLTNQRMVLYKEGVPIVDTPVVTGNPNIPGCETPTGCYAVDAMESPAVLALEDYSTPVTYWMPFCGNVGIHDAPWRSDFGGSIYFMEGSHGCVNTPYEMAEQIYNNIEVGAPVVVYK